MKLRSLAMVLMSLVLLALAATVRAADLEWSVEVLPAESGWLLAIPNGVNDREEVCGVYVEEGGWYFAQKGLVWRNGGYDDLASTVGLPAGKVYSQANAISNRGVVVGSAYDLDGRVTTAPQTAVAWDLRARTVRDLHPAALGYAESSAIAVDDTGRIVGAVRTFDPPNGIFDQRAIVWGPGAESTGRLLPFPAGSDFTVSAAFAVHESGLVVGWTQSDLFSSEPHATAWLPDGTILDLHEEILALDGDMSWTRAFGVDPNGRILGHALSFATGRGLPWTWTAEDGVQALDTGDGGPFIVTDGIQDYADLVVGADGDANAGEQRAAVWIDGMLTWMPLLDGMRNMWATGVNSKGVIVGQAILSPNAYWWQGSRGFIARPAPDAERLLARLIGIVERSGIEAGLRTALLAKLDAAARGGTGGIVMAGPLGAFSRLVHAQDGKKIPSTQVDELLADAAEIAGLLSD